MSDIDELFEIKETCLDNYRITKDGKIWSVRNKQFKYNKVTNGYKQTILNKKQYSNHRLVAQTFVPNVDNKPFVNHIDENKTNNHYKNLEWVTQKENTERHSKSISHERKVICLDKDSKNIIKTYDTITDAANDNNITRRAIQLVLNGKNKTANGYFWEYDDNTNYKDEVNLADGIKIYDYNNYYVFEDGTIYNTFTKKKLKSVKNDAGRYYVTLCKDRKKQNLYIQSVVADHYLKNKPSGKSIAEHIDGDKSNNNVLNLRWGNDMITKKKLKGNAIKVIDTKP